MSGWPSHIFLRAHRLRSSSPPLPRVVAVSLPPSCGRFHPPVLDRTAAACCLSVAVRPVFTCTVCVFCLCWFMFSFAQCAEAVHCPVPEACYNLPLLSLFSPSSPLVVCLVVTYSVVFLFLSRFSFLRFVVLSRWFLVIL